MFWLLFILNGKEYGYAGTVTVQSAFFSFGVVTVEKCFCGFIGDSKLNTLIFVSP